MSYRNEQGRDVPQGGKNGAAFVMLVKQDGTPVDPAGGSGGGSSLPSFSAVTILNVATSTTAGQWVNFPAQACEGLDVTNDTGTNVEYRRNGAGNAMPVIAGQSRLIAGITNANQISVRRIDQATTAVTVKAEAMKQ